MLTVGGLFAGIGGIELGLERTGGFQTVWQVENDEYATRVLTKHWPAVRRWGDVRTFPPDAEQYALWQQSQLQEQPGPSGRADRLSPQPQHDGLGWQVDLICGGFPCQPVSAAGKRRGEDDERWLWDEMCRVCETLRPRWVLAENVPGLLSAGTVRGELFGRVVRDLASLGYRVRWDCVPAAAVGAPHIRDRVFILAHAAEPSNRTQEQCTRQNAEGSNRSASGIGGSGSKPANVPHLLRSKCESGAGRRGVRQGDSEVADAEQHRLQGSQPAGGQAAGMRRRSAKPSGEDVSDADEQSVGWIAKSRGQHSQWSTEPDVGRVAHGIPKRVDRLRCLGNAVVPQVAEWIGQRILEAEQPEAYAPAVLQSEQAG